MPLKVYKRDSGIYHLRGTFEGRRIDRSLGTRERTVAERLRQAEEQAIASEAIHGPAVVVLFESAALAYMKSGKSVRFLKPMIRHFAGKRVASINRADLDVFAAKQYPNCADSTINRQVYSPASAILNFAAEQGWRPPIRIRKRPEPRGKTRWLTIKEAEELVAHAGPLELFVTMALESGARTGELLRLQWEDVDIDRQTFWLWDDQTKARKQRLAHFGSRTKALLKPSVGAVIRNNLGTGYKVSDKHGGAIAGTFARAAKRAGIKGITPHTLRHTWATWAMAVEPNIIRVKEHGGWSTTSQLERYAKLTPHGFDKLIKKSTWELFGR